MSRSFKKELVNILNQLKQAIINIRKNKNPNSPFIKDSNTEAENKVKRLKEIHESICKNNPAMLYEHLNLVNSTSNTIKEMALDAVREEAYKRACERYKKMKEIGNSE